jgi:CHAD domain-containing protein
VRGLDRLPAGRFNGATMDRVRQMNTGFPTGLAIHLAGRVHATRRRYRKRLARCQKRFSPAAVHDLRVETRRILALLDLLETLRFEDALRKLRKVFKRRLDTFDDLRDTQVQLRLLRPLWRDFPEAKELNNLLRCREKNLVSKHSQSIQAVKQARLNQRLKRLERGLRKCVSDRSPATSHEIAFNALLETFHQVAALRGEVRPDDPATIHRMRVRFKRFRYMSELLQPFLPRITTGRLERLRKYQAAAGDIQDLEVLLARLARAVKERELRPGAVAHLKRELLRRKRRAIISFMAGIGDLWKFSPAHAGGANEDRNC